MDSDRIVEILPLGNLNPRGGHVFPSDHGGFGIAEPYRSKGTTLYSPGDLTVTRIIAIERVTAGYTDYILQLKPCEDILVELEGGISLSEDLFDNISSFKAWILDSEYTAGGSLFRRWGKKVEIKVVAGEVLGTVGKNPWGAVDFYVFDKRHRPENVANPQRWEKSRSLTGVCFLSYYEEGPILDQLVSLVNRDKVEGEKLPCGSVNQDLPGTAQGSWFLSGVSGTGPEDPHLALVHSNIHPDRAVLSIGSSILGINSGFYEFLPKNSGLLNRDFSDIIPDGQTYGFQINGEYGLGFDGIIAVMMPDAETLWIEGLKGATTNPASWTFTQNMTIFER